MVWDLVEFLCCSILNRIFTLSILGCTRTCRCYEYYRCYRVPTLTILMTLNINISDFGCYQIFDAIELQRYSILTLNFDLDFWRYYVNLHSTDSTRYLSLMLSNFIANKFQSYPSIRYWMLIFFFDRKFHAIRLLIFQNSSSRSRLLITLNPTDHSFKTYILQIIIEFQRHYLLNSKTFYQFSIFSKYIYIYTSNPAKQNRSSSRLFEASPNIEFNLRAKITSAA